MFSEVAPVFAGAVGAWFSKTWPLALLILIVECGWALTHGIVRPAGVAAVAAIALLAWLCGRTPNGVGGMTLHGVFLLVAGMLSLHLLPGFSNPLLLGPVAFTPDAVPFTMYLDFDKTSVGFAGAGAIAGILLTLPFAIGLGAVRWEPKIPDGFWLWAFSNLLLVALAEEALFRGFFQNSLSRWLAGVPGCTAIAIGTTALVFGLAHFGSGPPMVLLAGLAGVAYGLAYHYGGLLASMLAHFGLNLCHILLFTYPLLIPR